MSGKLREQLSAILCSFRDSGLAYLTLSFGLLVFTFYMLELSKTIFVGGALLFSIIFLVIGISAFASTRPETQSNTLSKIIGSAVSFSSSGVFFMMIGFALIIFASKYNSATHHTINFAILVVGIACFLYGTGTQGMAQYYSNPNNQGNGQSTGENNTVKNGAAPLSRGAFGVWIFGGAGTLALLVGAAIISEHGRMINALSPIERSFQFVLRIDGDTIPRDAMGEYTAVGYLDSNPVSAFVDAHNVKVVAPYFPKSDQGLFDWLFSDNEEKQTRADERVLKVFLYRKVRSKDDAKCDKGRQQPIGLVYEITQPVKMNFSQTENSGGNRIPNRVYKNVLPKMGEISKADCKNVYDVESPNSSIEFLGVPDSSLSELFKIKPTTQKLTIPKS